jgi:hypothetical protein
MGMKIYSVIRKEVLSYESKPNSRVNTVPSASYLRKMFTKQLSDIMSGNAGITSLCFLFNNHLNLQNNVNRFFINRRHP